MKKLIATLCVLVMPCFMTGCQGSPDSQIPKLDGVIEKEVKISSPDEQYECKISHTPEGLTTLTFTSPQSLKDFTISRGCGKFGVTQSGLEAEYMKDPLPKDSAVKHFMDILDVLSSDERVFSLKNVEEGEKIFKGIFENKECEVVLSEKNEIIRICMHSPDIEVEFKQ